MTYALSPNTKGGTPIAQKSVAAASITASYTLVVAIFGSPLVWLCITSTLDQDVQISLDGSVDFIPIVAGGRLVIDEKTNGIVLAGWRGVYVKEIGNPTTGSLYVSGFTVAS